MTGIDVPKIQSVIECIRACHDNRISKSPLCDESTQCIDLATARAMIRVLRSAIVDNSAAPESATQRRSEDVCEDHG